MNMINEAFPRAYYNFYKYSKINQQKFLIEDPVTRPVFEGFDYNEEMKKLMNKHNEAIKVLPVLFSQNGYEVTVCDAPYANYKWIPDLSIYDDYPDIEDIIIDWPSYKESGKMTKMKIFPQPMKI